MAEHKAWIYWEKGEGDFLKGRYSREHNWRFDGGIVLNASPSPSVVPAPWSNPAFVDPEEAFVASVSSCHMLTFLFLASQAGLIVESYEDEAVGEMTKNERGIPWVSKIILNVVIKFTGEKVPDAAQEDALHHQAHQQCFIAQSVKTEILVNKKG